MDLSSTGMGIPFFDQDTQARGWWWSIELMRGVLNHIEGDLAVGVPVSSPRRYYPSSHLTLHFSFSRIPVFLFCVSLISCYCLNPGRLLLDYDIPNNWTDTLHVLGNPVSDTSTLLNNNWGISVLCFSKTLVRLQMKWALMATPSYGFDG